MSRLHCVLQSTTEFVQTKEFLPDVVQAYSRLGSLTPYKLILTYKTTHEWLSRIHLDLLVEFSQF